MFIIDLTYKKDLVEVEKYLPEHISFLDKYYASGHFIASGRKNPRIGGIILVNTDSKETVQKILFIFKRLQHILSPSFIRQSIRSTSRKYWMRVMSCRGSICFL